MKKITLFLIGGCIAILINSILAEIITTGLTTTQTFVGKEIKIGDKPDCLVLDPKRDTEITAERIIIDGNLTLTGMNLALHATEIVVPSDSTIDTSGSNGTSYSGMTARYGVFPGGNAEAGRCGGNGENGGNIKIHAVSFDLQKKLTLIANGGDGGHGEQGGKGAIGQNGVRGADGPQIPGISKGHRGGDGTPGGQGGNSGSSGNGGNSGKIEIQALEIKTPSTVVTQVASDTSALENLIISNKPGIGGPRIIGGVGGVGGKGGEPGCGYLLMFEGGLFGKGDYWTYRCDSHNGPGNTGATGRNGNDGREGHDGTMSKSVLKLGNVAK